MKNIVLIPNTDKDANYEITLRAARLLSEAGAVLYAENTHVSLVGKFGIIGYAPNDFPKNAECLLVFGGDGSILDAAALATTYSIPLLGVNMGRLGYLAEVEVSDLSALTDILSDRFTVRKLRLLSVSVDGKALCRRAVNEVTVSRGGLSHIADMELCAGDGSLQYRADGLILSTPTGSTAYSLSAGGPVIEPSLDLVTVTPICPHSFFARSVVFSSDTVVTVKNLTLEPLSVSVDGRCDTLLPNGCVLTVTRASETLSILSLKKREFLQILKQKMSF